MSSHSEAVLFYGYEVEKWGKEVEGVEYFSIGEYGESVGLGLEGLRIRAYQGEVEVIKSLPQPSLDQIALIKFFSGREDDPCWILTTNYG